MLRPLCPCRRFLKPESREGFSLELVSAYALMNFRHQDIYELSNGEVPQSSAPLGGQASIYNRLTAIKNNERGASEYEAGAE